MPYLRDTFVFQTSHWWYRFFMTFPILYANEYPIIFKIKRSNSMQSMIDHRSHLSYMQMFISCSLNICWTFQIDIFIRTMSIFYIYNDSRAEERYTDKRSFDGFCGRVNTVSLMCFAKNFIVSCKNYMWFWFSIRNWEGFWRTQVFYFYLFDMNSHFSLWCLS